MSRCASEVKPAFWAAQFSSPDSPPVAQQATARVRAALAHPQGFGNYFSYGTAIAILGIDPREPFADGSLSLGDEYVDLGYMWSQLGPPASALAALAAHAPSDQLARYLPDLSDPLRELVATKKFKRPRDAQFDVLGTEGVQGALGFAFLSLLEGGDEIIITDPAYMHFATAPVLAGAHVRKIPLTRHNRFRLDPDEVRAAMTPRTKMLIVCDPINPFGTVQTKDELLAITRDCERRKVLVLNNITHGTHQTNAAAAHVPIPALGAETNIAHVLTATGLSKGYALAALRLGFLAGAPALLSPVARARMEITGIHIHPFAQPAGLAALGDDAYVHETTLILRRNLQHLRATLRDVGDVALAVEPDYGFCACLDVAGTGVSAQELTVALFRRGICVISGDALGEVGATQYIRINYSARDIAKLERFRAMLPLAISDARSRRYLPGVRAFYQRQSSRQAQRILGQLERLDARTFVAARKPLTVPQPSTVGCMVRDRVDSTPSKGKSMTTRIPRSFLPDIQLNYGPLDVLSTFFRQADDAMRKYGVHLAFGSFDELLQVNRANQSSWRAVIPTFDARFSELTPDSAFCLLGYSDAGEVVATQACRLFKWQHTSFFEAAQDLSLFYAQPDRDKLADESCEITAEAARNIRGRVAFSGGGWYRPDYRGKYLSYILPRISRAYAFTRWSTDYTASMFQDSVLAGGMAERCGYTRIDWKVHVKGSPMGNIKFAFVWMEPDELIDDLRTFGSLIDTKINRRVENRYA